jgi:beta-lactamase regulating signal transducer with metallopeptidase domain
MPVHGVDTTWFVLDLSMRALVAAGAVALLLRLLRVQAAAVRHAAWTIVLVAMPLMPLLPSIVPPLPLPSSEEPRTDVDRIESPPLATPTPSAAVAGRSNTLTIATQVAAPPAMPVAPREAPARGNWIPAMSAGVYVAGVLLFVGRLLYGWHLLRRMVLRSTRTDLPGIVYESREVAVPLSAGALRPVIILPTAWKTWPEDTLAAVMAHEMAHGRRRDPLTACFARLNRAIFWFHPLAWWLERQLAITAEHACDEAAAAVVPERRRYAEILIEMADVVRRQQGRVVWQAVGVNGAGRLHERIDRVLRGAPSRVSRAKAFATLAVSATLIVLVVACRQQVVAVPLKEDPELAKRLVEQDESIKKHEAARDMAQAQADELEKNIDANPQDYETRQKLVWYYSQSSTVAWDKKVAGLRRHALWLIEHAPEHEVRPPWLSPQYDPQGFATAKNLWEAHLAKPNASPYLVYRAASFFLPHDKPYAEQLLLRGMKMDPDSAAIAARMPPSVGGFKWQEQLAFLYASALRGSESVSGTYNDLRTHLEWLNTPFAMEVRQKLEASTDAVMLARVGDLLARTRPGNAAQAKDQKLNEALATVRKMGVRYLQRAVELDPNLERAKTSLYISTSTAKLNEADRLANRAHESYMISEDITDYAQKKPEEAKAQREQAVMDAKQVLEMAKAHPGDPAYSAAVMTARHILATDALREGDRKEAISHLLESTKVPTSDQIRYAPPFSWLRPVNRLLKEGEREGVIQFLEAYAQLTSRDRQRLLDDAKAIREGRMPVGYQHTLHRETTPSPFKPRQ